jgi:hypothetical protein
MIQISRSVVQQLRAVFRRLVRKSSGVAGQPVVFDAGPDGLHVRLHHYEVCAEYHQPGALAPESFVVPLETLADFEGRKKDLVTLEGTSAGLLQVRWQDGVVPQVRDYPQLDRGHLPKFPARAEETIATDPAILKALVDAAQTTTNDTAKFALDHIQLRGAGGQIVASDRQQLLVQSGFQFGWTEDVLIPAFGLAALRDLPQAPSASIGKTATHVTLICGDWTLHFPINTKGTFPETESVIPSLIGPITRARLDAGDGEFLAQAMPRLPGKEIENSPVTLDLNGQLLVRTPPSDDGRLTELLLANSEVTGKALRFGVDRRFVTHALALGFNEICVIHPDKPIVFRDEKRKFVVMPLEKFATGPSDKANRISSAGSNAPTEPAPQRQNAVLQVRPAVQRGEATLPTVHAPTAANGVQTLPRNGAKTGSRKIAAGSLAALVGEAEAIKSELRRTFSRSHQLLMAIKKYRRQSKMIQSSLASLRHLKSVAG